MQALALITLSESLASGPDLNRYFTVVGLMVAALAVVGYGLKRFAAANGRLGSDRKGLVMLDMLPLGGRRQLAIVRCYDRTFALGLGEKDVRFIAELDSVAAPEPNNAEARSASSAVIDPFEEMIGKAQKRLATDNKPDQHGPTSVKEMV